MPKSSTLKTAQVIEELTGVPPPAGLKKPTRKERQEQKARVQRFLALPPALQEGILKYGEKMRNSYEI